MGVIFKQSLNNTIITYIGFGIGALNTLVLYLNFMSPTYYGLVNVVLSASLVLMPVLAFGVPNTLIKFYSSFTDEKKADGFLTLMLYLPLLLILPMAGISFLAYESIGNFLSKQNAIVKDYVWPIFLIGTAMAYFEIFYAWARVRMRSVFGNFMKEVFSRLGVTLLLLGLYFKYIAIDQFIPIVVSLYMARVVIMALYAFRVRRLSLVFQLPKNTTNIFSIYQSYHNGGLCRDYFT